MDNEEINTLIEQLQVELSSECEKYTNALETGKDSNILRGIRDKVHTIEIELQMLYSES